MRVTFVIPPLNLAGGTRVIAIYAELLKRRGHRVSVVCPPHGTGRSLRTLLAKRPVGKQPSSHFDGRDVEVKVLDEPRPVREEDVDVGDVIIATWWETAEWVGRMSSRVGRKIYFIQHHEIHNFLSPRRTRATYALPMHKIVVAKWLADVMCQEYGDCGVDVVPNGVDHDQFRAIVRGKQPQPTVGLLYSEVEWKRFGLAMSVVQRLRERVPGLRVHCFGMDYPPAPLPGFVSFSFQPPQDMLRVLYSSCDVWLSASSSEGFNLPAMEAMACRTPVVATQTGWPAEALVQGVNGACVPVDDVDALERETERILKLPDAEWRAVSEAAFETVRENSWEHSTDLFEKALQRASAAVS